MDVPALRKRLESESRVLAKRMSFASDRTADHDPDPAPAPPHPPKSSAIPRPSLHSPRLNGRARTYSQPDNPTPDPSRPTSPRVSDVKPTRIPVAARARTTSASSHAYRDLPRPTTPPIPSIRHQASAIMNEPPPFPRPSADSEERPFEHWYRGDVHRNGGVGEFRVVKHLEMLQIANYAHTLRDASRRRRRADSVGATTRESLSLDDAPTAMVLDEAPLTDIEPDTDTEPESFYDAYAGVEDPDPTSTASPPGLPASSSRSQTPTPTHPLPDAPKPASDPPRAAPPRTSADSTVPPHTRTPRATSPISQSSDQSHTKRRAKSPAASSPASTPKKPRTRVKTPPSTSRKDDPRISIAAYPTPEGDVVDAIPTWTQPVQKSANWDEVVLPVVARKKGLDGQYEQADGSPKPKPSPVKPAPGTFGFDYTKYRPPRLDEEEIQLNEFGLFPEPPEQEDPVPPLVEPSPKPKPIPIPISHPVIVEPEEPIRKDFRQLVPKPPDSPAPFSRYHREQPVPTINVTRPSTEMADYQQDHEYKEVAGGCCKCVIM